MLEESFDIKANRFGLLLCNDQMYNRKMEDIIEGIRENNLTQSDINKMICTMTSIAMNDGGIIVDFDEVDGLLMKDLKGFDAVNNRFVLFVTYDKVSGFNAHGDERWQLRIKDSLVFLYADKDLDTSVDDMITEYYLKNYEKFPKEQQRGARCFLQRYKYGTKEKTDEKLFSKKA